MRMSLRCPQVCATSRLERPLQCVVVMILRLAARRIMLVPHEWTLCYSRGIVVVVEWLHYSKRIIIDKKVDLADFVVDFRR